MYYPDNNQIFSFFEGAGDNPLFIGMAGIEQCSSSYSIKRQSAECSVLAYVAQGAGIIYEKGCPINVPTGSVFILEKHQKHEYYANAKNPWLILWFNISGELFLSMIAQYGLNRRVYPNVGEEIKSLFEQALLPGVENGMTEKDQFQLNLSLHQILLALYRKQFTLHKLDSGKYTEIHQYLMQYSTPSQITTFSLERMERELNISIRQLNRIYKRETGITPYEFILQRKAQLAKQYLLGTAFSIQEISQMLGFNDPYYFSNFFKKRYLMSPAAYRKQQNG